MVTDWRLIPGNQHAFDQLRQRPGDPSCADRRSCWDVAVRFLVVSHLQYWSASLYGIRLTTIDPAMASRSFLSLGAHAQKSHWPNELCVKERWNGTRTCLAAALMVLPCSVLSVCADSSSIEASNEDTLIEQLLSRVSEGATWQDLAPELRADFERRASAFLVKDREAWGLLGLKQKEDLLVSAPTPSMADAICSRAILGGLHHQYVRV